MWMMGYNGGSEFNLSNSLDGRKLMPLDPGPISNNNNATSSPHLLSRLHGTDLFAINHHISSMGEQGKRELNNNNTESSVVVSTRWNPTPEQLRSLEDLYQRGTRTPSAEQIQHITARRFGKIEGKNVFYWFQNHKARERQKRRRQLTALDGRDQSSASRTVFEVEQTKNWAPPTNRSTLAEESVSIQRAAIKRGECRSDDDGWVEKGELQHSSSRRVIERNATWQMMQLMSCQPPSCSNSTHQLINSTSTSCTATATETAAIRSRMDPSAATDHLNNYTTPSNIDKEESSIISGGESQTLQLFPIGRINEKETDDDTMSSDFITTYTPPYQYFEFLPLKN